MNIERGNWRRDPIEDEAHRINRMLANDCFEREVGQALREDARIFSNPRAFNQLIERIMDLNSRQYRGDRLVQGNRGELYIEDRSGCSFGTGLDRRGRRVRQPDRICPPEPAWRSDRGILDRRCDPGIDPGINPRFPRFEVRIDPGINRGFDPRPDSRFHPRPEFRITLPDARDLTRNLPDPRDVFRSVPLPRLDRLPRIGELPRLERLPNPRDLMDRLPTMSDGMRHLPLPGRAPAEGRQHILIDPISRLPLPGQR